MNKIISKTHTFISLPLFVKLWFVPVFLLLGLCRLAILTISFRRIAPHLGFQCGVAAWVPLINQQKESRARKIQKTIHIAAKYTPWEATCFPQAITARLLLGLFDIPYNLFFGLDKKQKIEAHAWVVTGRVPVTGGNSFQKFTVVQCFSSISQTKTSIIK